MPVSVDDPFLLASFSSTTHQHQQRQAVCCTPEETRSEPTQEQEDAASLLVVAIQGEGVQLFNTADQKCILSYSTPPGYSFTGPAQILRKSAHLRHIYAVIAKGTDVPVKEEGKVIWMWKDESSSPSVTSVADADNAMQEDSIKSSSARKTVHKFDHKIHQLFVSTLLPNHVLLTNSDGSISLVTEDLKRVVSTTELLTAPATKSSKKERKDVAQNQTGTTIWATTYNTTGSWIPSSALARNILVIMTIVKSSEEKVVATLSYVNEEQRGFSTFGQVEISAAAGSSGFSFDVKTGQLSFLTASGQLKIYDFEVSQRDHIVSASEILTLPLPGYAVPALASTRAVKKGGKATPAIDTKAQHVDTLALGDNYLAIAGIHQNDGKEEQTLTIWDTRYGTLQAKHVVPGPYSAGSTTCQLALLPESVLTMTISTLHNTTIKSDIFLCPFYAEPMSLLGAMGKMKDTAPFLGQKGSILAQDAYTSTTTALLTPLNINGIAKAKDIIVNGADLESTLAAGQATEKEALESLSSESRTASAHEFEAVFFKHVKRQTTEAVKDLMERFGVDADEAKAAVVAADEKRVAISRQTQLNKTGNTQDMEVDTEPVVKAASSVMDKEKSKSKKNKQKKKKTDKVDKADKKAAKKTKADDKAKDAKDVLDGSSSESSSDEDEDEVEENEVVVLSSDDEHKDNGGEGEDEDEQDYEVTEEQERIRNEAYLNALDEWRKTEAEAIKKYKTQRRLLRAGRKQTPLPELSHHFLTTVIGRCFAHQSNGQPDMSFWPAKVIEYLLENQLVGNSNPGSGQAGIALELMEREQWPLLELAVKKLYDIPEMDMIVMLKQVIGLNKNRAGTTASTAPSTTTVAGAGSSGSPSPSAPDTPHFLNLIMAAPRNDIFMQQALKRLTTDDLSVVLEILKGWMDIWGERGGIGHQNQQPDRKQLPGGLPGYGLLVDFTTLIMDVHFPSLILSPQLHPVLKAIQLLIQRETEISNYLEQALRGPLGLFDRKHKEMVRRKKMATVAGFSAFGNQGAVSGTGGATADKRRRRKWEGGEGIPDYGVEIIHL
ncbi:hypothetical protein BC939DRAFT_503973 [Gamsiella multidivaricata]|uniref:uncharacterized protein n=1 Tax=Gamsiella multidivaricata TaxID=101098 RepID=UPI00221E4BA7|nr:uncharacterized protein BC939DRAFT_503973 [Gamsiella multidivaricata]KAG0351814.1 hypothetical protein BGZ54_003079 [Gamsiella multidivaricata]KAI7822195.1 hypothetical protein BC939DRAFT_503973 [Gamsiella multidivaricata]